MMHIDGKEHDNHRNKYVTTTIYNGWREEAASGWQEGLPREGGNGATLDWREWGCYSHR